MIVLTRRKPLLLVVLMFLLLLVHIRYNLVSVIDLPKQETKRGIDGFIPETTQQLREALCPEFCNANNCNDAECAFCEFTCGGRCTYRQEWHDANSGHSPGYGGNVGDFCTVTSFVDVTPQVFKDDFWYIYPQMGRPTQSENSPLFVDLNGDGVMDMLQASHHRTLAEGYIPPDHGAGRHSALPTELVDVSHRIEMSNPNPDSHGCNIVDLDGDGVLDLLIAVGGGLGGLKLDRKDTSVTDNNLLWGERKQDPKTGEMATFFKGGRDAAKEAGIGMRLRRGRMNYIFDANGDGLLDIYFAADRPRSNYLVPGALMINQGDRTWKEDPNVREYSQAILYTDVDGDGFANEFVVSRDLCYTQDHHDYPPEIVDFCKSRPVGTTAVFKYNRDSNQMEDIGKKYYNVSATDKGQPPCCPLGQVDTFGVDNRNCFVRSTASGDFDKDQLADQIFLYGTKLVFYFSSDREVGVLPFGGQYAGTEIYLPQHCHAKAVRVVDLDNDGKEEILVGCFEPATFLVYTQGDREDEWTLDNGCNDGNSLGDLNSVFLAQVRPDDYERACEDKSKHPYAEALCLIRNGNHTKKSLDLHTKAKLEGLSTVDFNNDGLKDLVVSYRSGHTLFLKNSPVAPATNHRFIAFKFVGAGRGNMHGIGATLILHSEGCDGCSTQFREISSHQHETDKWGYKDDRIYFGLGPEGKPTHLTVRWPNGVVQEEDLSDWEFNKTPDPVAITQTS